MSLVRRYAVAMILAVAALIIAVVLYPRLPAQVPVHWSATGVVDSWMPKSIGTFIQPASALAVVALLIICEPKSWREPDAGAIQWIYPTMVAVLAGFMLYLTILMLLAAMGAHLDIPTDVIVGIGILFAAIGSGLGKVPQNRRVGIRVRWTLSNREIWSRTHRLAGWLFAVGGLATAAFALISRSGSSALFGAGVLIACALAAVIYSFVLSRHLPPDEASGG